MREIRLTWIDQGLWRGGLQGVGRLARFVLYQTRTAARSCADGDEVRARGETARPLLSEEERNR